MYSKIVRSTVSDPAKTAIVGLDLSLRGTGLAVLLDGCPAHVQAWTDKKGLQKRHSDVLCWFSMKGSSESAKAHRLSLIVDWVLQNIEQAQERAIKVVVAIEGYAFSKRSAGLSDMHELGGVIKWWLWEHGIPFRIYDPLSLKLAWTGSGLADKTDMVKAACYQFPECKTELQALAQDSEEGAGNLADAILLAGMLREELRVRDGYVPLHELPERMRRILMRVTKSEPEALLTRPLVEQSSTVQPELVTTTCS